MTIQKRKKIITIKNIDSVEKVALITHVIITLCLIVLLTAFLGNTLFSKSSTYETEEIQNGQDVICYITDTGDKYHKSNCQYLKYSKKQTTMYNAEKSGHSYCSKCWDYPKPIYKTVVRVNFEKRYTAPFFISLFALGILSFLLWLKIKRLLYYKA